MTEARDKHGAHLLAFLVGHAVTGALSAFVFTLALGRWDPVLPRDSFLVLSVATAFGGGLLAMCGWCITTCSAIELLGWRGPTRSVAWLCGAGSCLALIAVRSSGSRLPLLLAIPAILGLLAALLSGTRLAQAGDSRMNDEDCGAREAPPEQPRERS